MAIEIEGSLKRTIRIDEARNFQLCRELKNLINEAKKEKVIIEIGLRRSNRHIEISGQGVKLIMGSKVFSYSAPELEKEMENENGMLRSFLVQEICLVPGIKSGFGIEKRKTAAITRYCSNN